VDDSRMTAGKRLTVGEWEQRSEWPLAALAALFLVGYAWPILDDSLAPTLHQACLAIDYATWAIFIVDYVARIYLARGERLRYWAHHLVDLAIIVLPFLRPLRLLRLLLLLKVLNRRATDSLQGRVVTYVAGSAGLLLFCASLAVLDAERHATGANIHGFGDALWWSAVTVLTVGYGDRYPVTVEGRFVAIGLMLGGIALIGVVTASFATWLIDRVRQTEVQVEALTREDMAAVMHRLKAIEDRLDLLLMPDSGPESVLAELKADRRSVVSG
jgi:voltage-gated potassium channel